MGKVVQFACVPQSVAARAEKKLKKENKLWKKRIKRLMKKIKVDND